MGCAPDVSCLAHDRGKGHRSRWLRRHELGVPQERGCPLPENGVFAPPSPSYNIVQGVRELHILAIFGLLFSI